jgi:putative DNA primase/helicase
MTNTPLNFARLLNGELAGGNRILCPGPNHSRSDRSLAVKFNADGTFITHSFAGDDWRECRDYVKARLCLSDDMPLPANDNLPKADIVTLADKLDKIAYGMRIWRESIPIAGTLGEAYLASRGLAYEGDALRFHPRCPFGKERHHALVALMTGAVNGEPRGVHRTALLPDGSGKATPGKMMLGAAKGAVVRLSADEDVTESLAIAEGIETALAVDFRPVWACMSAGSIESFPVLPGIEALTIFADNDVSGTGLKAARKCANRWHTGGHEVTIIIPTETGVDFATQIEVAA